MSDWPATETEARAEQERLRGLVETEDRFGPVHRIAALDAHHGPAGNLTWGAVVMLSFPALQVLDQALVCQPTPFPYVPGFLSFREAPALLEALRHLREPPDLILVDGQGTAHPRRFGLACHVGVLADIPAIGIAKSRLTGRYEEPGGERGQWSPLIHRREVVGAVLRTRPKVSPVFVSPGHRVSLPTAIDLVMRCTGRYRLPEPIRLADRLSREHGPD